MKFNKFNTQETWKKAAEVEMVIYEEYPNINVGTACHNFKFNEKERREYTEEEKKELEIRGEKDRKVACWVGHLKYMGWGGYEQDHEGAYVWYSRAAAAGHVLAIYCKGEMLWYAYGVAQDREAALRYYEVAGTSGYRFACHRVGSVHKEANRFFLSALWYRRGIHFNSVQYLKRNHPTEICPWGVWRPDCEYHSFVPDHIHSAVMTTLLFFKRLGITRYIARHVCAYIVTRSGWEFLNK